MSVGIVVKKYEGYNQALGKYINSRSDFYNTMKKLGCDFQEKVKVKNCDPKPYEPSKWSRDMVGTIKQSKNRKKKKHWRPGDRFFDQLKQRGITKEKYDEARKLSDKNQGGFNS